LGKGGGVEKSASGVALIWGPNSASAKQGNPK
jgi:hypothetical protein